MKKLFAVAILCLATLTFSGCQTAPPLEGREFSKVSVTGDEVQSSEQTVRSGLIQAGAKLDVAGATSLTVNTMIGEYNGVPFAILVAETPNRVRAFGFSRLSDSGGIQPQQLVGSATGDLTKILGRKLPRKGR